MADDSAALRWQTHGERIIYDNPWVQLALVDVEPPDGSRYEHHVVRLPRIAIALIVIDDQALTLWRHRFAVQQWGYELPGGLVEAKEDPAITAARETREETGWQPLGEPQHLINFEPLPGMINAPVDVYLWHNARYCGAPTDQEEAARICWLPLSQVVELAGQGQFLGSATIAVLLYYLALQKK